MFRVKKNDQVMVIAGKNKGKKGKVLRVFPQVGRVTVEGLNLIKRHVRRSQANPQGAIISRESPLPMDRVMPVCPRCNKGIRVGFQTLADGTKNRICRSCKEAF